MARARSPKRDQALQLWLDSGRTRLLKDIAAELGVSEEQIRKWKNQDGWINSNVTNGNSNVTNQKTRKKNDSFTDAETDAQQVIDNPDLTDKQRLFCLYYSRNFNATSAYMKAYESSYETALTEGPANLGKPRIQNEIQRLKHARYSRALLSSEDIFQKYMDIAFADLTDYVEFGREEIEVLTPQGEVKKAKVNTVRFKESCEVDGTILAEVKQGRDGASVKLNDRMKALEWLADHMDMATEEQRAHIEQMKANTERLKRTSEVSDDDGVTIINDAGQKTGQNQ